jgi:hypothetical protein
MLGKPKKHTFVRVLTLVLSICFSTLAFLCLSNLLRNVTWQPAGIFRIAPRLVAILLSCSV